MTSNFPTNFLQDNFLCEDDWGGGQSKVFEEFELNADNALSQRMCSDNFNGPGNGLSNHYGGHYQYQNKDSAFIGMNSGIESPPLTPPEEQLSMSSHSPHFETVDELLADLVVDESHMQQFSNVTYGHLEALDQLEMDSTSSSKSSCSRGRSPSSGSASSTSAYSSQSSTPPPVAKSVTDLFDQAFHEAQLGCAKTMSTKSCDEGFHETVPIAEDRSVHVKTHEIVQHMKNVNPEKFTQKNVPDDMEEFDRKVQDALRETNRLLRIHNLNPKEVSPQQKGIAKPTKLNRVVNELRLKRKADESVPKRAKKLLVSKTPANVVKPGEQKHMVVTTNPQTTILAQPCTPCQSLPVSSLQIPLQTIDSSTMRIVVKREPVNSSIFVTSTKPQASVGTVSLTTNQNVFNVPDCQSQIVAIGNSDQTKSSYIVKDETNNCITVSSIPTPHVTLNTGPCSPQVIKVMSGPSSNNLAKNQPKILPCTNKKQVHIPNTGVAGKPNEPRNSKLLMGSAVGPKKPIVPALPTVHQVSQPVPNVMTELNLCGNTRSDPLLAIEGSLVHKKQQRMIKNRESACQSRQKRKEYVHSLEQQLQEYVQENQQLRTVNQQLRERVAELEQQNTNFRKHAVTSMTGQRKAACILMLVLFIGFNVHPFSFLSNQSITGIAVMSKDGIGNATDDTSLPLASIENSYHARQLLSHEEQTAKALTRSSEDQDMSATTAVALADIEQQRAFWVDDLVKDCKKKHFGRIQEVLQDTSSISLQRLLRRKLREELGIRVPLTVPRIRRIAYGGLGSATYEKSSNILPPDDVMTLETESPEFTLPPTSPKMKKKVHDTKAPVSPASCDHITKDIGQPNETESARVSDDLAQWVQRHKTEEKKPPVDQVLHTHHSSFYKVPKRKMPKNSQRKSSPKKTGMAVYQKRDNRLKKLLDAIDRKNDTVYVISFSQDHILLPAMTRNSSRQTLMSLVLPTVAPNESFVNDDEHQTMIQINCEVTATEYFRVRRDVFPNDMPYSKSARLKEKGSTKRNGYTAENPKRHAYHGSATKAKRQRSENSASFQDDDATVTDVVEL